MNSPLQLNRIVFTRIHIDTLVETPPAESRLATKAALHVRIRTAAPRRFEVKLDVQFGPEEGAVGVYSGNVIGVGEFELSPNFKADNAEKLAIVNGASIVFGAIRELVTNLTARSPLGAAVTLSTMSFLESADQVIKEIEAQRVAQKKSGIEA